MHRPARGVPARSKRLSWRKLGFVILCAVLCGGVLVALLWAYVGGGDSVLFGDFIPNAELGLTGVAIPSSPTATAFPPKEPEPDPVEVPVNPFAQNETPSAATSYNVVVTDRKGEQSVVTHAIKDGVEMLFPLVTFRDRLQAPAGHEPADWQSRFMPTQAYRLPAWASVKEKNTLRHASIFISIAAFRDHECATTLESALASAASPHRIYAGISEERRLTDVNCLSKLQLGDFGRDGAAPASDGESAVARRLLYGAHAPAGIRVRMRALRWADILVDPTTKQASNISIAAARAAYGRPGDTSATRAVPPGVYMENKFMERDSILCVYSDLEVERDRLTLDPAVATPDVVKARVRRGRLGGPQERPAEALRGCRITTRVTPETSARGPTFGRYVTSLFFFHQDYYMVVDSHSRFPIDWDMKMIARVFQLKTRGVLSHYPNGYTPEEPMKEYGQASTMSMCRGVILANGMPKLGARWMGSTDAPALEAFAAAGYMFGDAQYVLDTPFDPFLPYLFDGEEILYSARMWTSGWDMYAPGQANIFHHYLRKDTPKFWALVQQEQTRLRVEAERRALFLLERAHPWVEVLVRRGVNLSMADQVPYVPPEERRIVDRAAADKVAGVGIERVYYGMGTARTLDQYWHHTQLTDDFVKAKDNENRWEGGSGLCDRLPN